MVCVIESATFFSRMCTFDSTKHKKFEDHRCLDCFRFGYKLPNRQLHVLFCGGCLGFIRLLVESASIKKEMSYVPK